MMRLTAQERELLPKLRDSISDILTTQDENRSSDGFLTSWLRHKEHNLSKVESALRKNANWREANGIDQVYKEQLDELAKLVPYEHFGIDKEGRPIMWIPFGKWDTSAVVERGLQNEFHRYAYQFCEYTELLIKNENKKRIDAGDNEIVWQCTIVVDLEGYSFKQLLNPRGIKLIKDLASCAEANWPLKIGSIIGFNAPSIVKTLLNLIKPFLSKYTRSVIQLYNHNREEWEEVLKKHIHIDDILVCYGGKREASP